MNKRQSNSDKVITGCFVGGYYGSKNDSLRCINNIIYDNNTPIAQYLEEYCNFKDQYQRFLIVTMQNFKSQPSWRTHKKALIRSANEQDLPVIYVPQLDMGFGVNNNKFTTIEEEYKQLIKLSKTNNACVVINDNTIIAYAFDQIIDDEYLTAEQILCDYIKLRSETSEFEYSDNLKFICLFEPDYESLREMINIGAHDIIFAANHDKIYDTNEYWDLVDDIYGKRIKSPNNSRINYVKRVSYMVNKHYERGKYER